MCRSPPFGISRKKGQQKPRLLADRVEIAGRPLFGSRAFLLRQPVDARGKHERKSQQSADSSQRSASARNGILPDGEVLCDVLLRSWVELLTAKFAKDSAKVAKRRHFGMRNSASSKIFAGIFTIQHLR